MREEEGKEGWKGFSTLPIYPLRGLCHSVVAPSCSLHAQLSWECRVAASSVTGTQGHGGREGVGASEITSKRASIGDKAMRGFRGREVEGIATRGPPEETLVARVGEVVSVRAAKCS